MIRYHVAYRAAADHAMTYMRHEMTLDLLIGWIHRNLERMHLSYLRVWAEDDQTKKQATLESEHAYPCIDVPVFLRRLSQQSPISAHDLS